MLTPASDHESDPLSIQFSRGPERLHPDIHGFAFFFDGASRGASDHGRRVFPHPRGRFSAGAFVDVPEKGLGS